MSTRIAVAFLLTWLLLGCEPEPMPDPATGPKPVSAGETVSAEGSAPAAESVGDGAVDDAAVLRKLQANAEALCARKGEQSDEARSWFACGRAATGPASPCRTAQVEAGREWLESLQMEAIQEIGVDAALGCLRESTGAGVPTLGQLPKAEDWLTDYVLVRQCVRDRIERTRADAAP